MTDDLETIEVRASQTIYESITTPRELQPSIQQGDAPTIVPNKFHDCIMNTVAENNL